MLLLFTLLIKLCVAKASVEITGASRCFLNESAVVRVCGTFDATMQCEPVDMNFSEKDIATLVSVTILDNEMFFLRRYYPRVCTQQSTDVTRPKSIVIDPHIHFGRYSIPMPSFSDLSYNILPLNDENNNPREYSMIADTIPRANYSQFPVPFLKIRFVVTADPTTPTVHVKRFFGSTQRTMNQPHATSGAPRLLWWRGWM